MPPHKATGMASPGAEARHDARSGGPARERLDLGNFEGDERESGDPRPALPLASPRYRRRHAPKRAGKAAGSDLSSARPRALPDEAPPGTARCRLPSGPPAAAPCRRFPCLAKAGRLAGTEGPWGALRALPRRAQALPA